MPLVMTDIDGTILTDDHQLTAETIRFVQEELEANGIPLILSSSRMPKGITPIAGELALPHTLIAAYGGGLILENGHKIYSKSLSVRQFAAIMDHLESRPVHVSIYRDNEWMVQEIDQWAWYEAEIVGFKPREIDLDFFMKDIEITGETPHKLLVIGETEAVQALAEELVPLYGETYDFVLSKENYLEVIPKGTSKGTALAFLADYLNVPLEQTIGIGDNFNDIELIRQSGIGVVMGNGPEAVKQEGQLVTTTNNENGFIHGVRQALVQLKENYPQEPIREPLFFKPVLHEKIWGGQKLETIYDYDIPSATTGECWTISGHPNGVTQVINGQLKGQGLDKIYQTHPELFGNPQGKEFPLLAKILDAKEDLSVQVHPDDEYGLAHAGEQGKTECWYVIDADPGAYIYYGHSAQTKEAFQDAVEKADWDSLFTKVPVKKGDFYFVPAGTIHAIGGGILILEVQQSSDTTYRVYDFDRQDASGKKRDLHLEQVYDVTMIPHRDPVNNQVSSKHGDAEIIQLIDSDYFAVSHWFVDGKAEGLTHYNKYTLINVINGHGDLTVDGQTYSLVKGNHLIIPATVDQFDLSGKLDIIASSPGPKNS